MYFLQQCTSCRGAARKPSFRLRLSGQRGTATRCFRKARGASGVSNTPATRTHDAQRSKTDDRPRTASQRENKSANVSSRIKMSVCLCRKSDASNCDKPRWSLSVQRRASSLTTIVAADNILNSFLQVLDRVIASVSCGWHIYSLDCVAVTRRR